MGWQDRDYNNSSSSPGINYGGSPFSNPLMTVLFGSVPLGNWFGIAVRVHATLLWLIGFRLLSAGRIGWMDALISSFVIFAIVLLHEFGHCIGAKLVGGHAEQILLWPLGGLAFTDTARTPWARFVTVAFGPLVNLIIGIALGAVVFFVYHVTPPLNPLFPWLPAKALEAYWAANPNVYDMYDTTAGRWLWWTYVVNLSIFFFNLIPMYPLDGGKLAQIALWKPLGYFRSMKVSCIIGMVGAVIMGFAGLLLGSFMFFLAIFGFMDCYQQLRILKYTQRESESEDGYDLSAAWDNPGRPTKKKLKKRWFATARKNAQKDQAEQAKIDAILAKVKEKGLHSLTWWEKRTLKKATERQRQRDMAGRM